MTSSEQIDSLGLPQTENQVKPKWNCGQNEILVSVFVQKKAWKNADVCQC